MSECLEPAFPLFEADLNTGATYAQYGMTLRDYFAAQCMNGLLARAHYDYFTEGGSLAPKFVEAAYHLADAMLEARKTKP